MSYITVKLNDQEQGLKFNQLAYIEFYKKADLENYEGTFHYAAVWAGLKANAYVKGIEFTQDWEAITDAVDMMSDEDKTKVIDVFNSTAYYKKLIEVGKEAQEAEIPKKKTSKQDMKKN